MGSSGDRFFSDRPSPIRELQAPRPTPLKVSKDSHKIKKPSVAPPEPAGRSTEPAPQQYRPPVIIYTLSPKVVHSTPGEFMSLVQRLTGAGPSSSSSSTSSASITAPSTHPYVLQRHGDGTGGGVDLSPSARLPFYEKAAESSPDGGEKLNVRKSSNQDAFLLDDQPANTIFPGIKSPVPSSLPWISPNLFLPPASQNQINFVLELSPAIQRSKSFMDNQNTFLASPNSILYSPVVPSPGAYWDLFNQYQEL